LFSDLGERRFDVVELGRLLDGLMIASIFFTRASQKK
jgi:hypothetical protein